MKTDNLNKQYEEHLKEFNKTGNHPHPSELLALLLLPEKDKYRPIGSNGEFYQYYKKQINEKIEQIVADFNLTKEEIINYIEKTGIAYDEDNYQIHKIWFVFCYGFVALQWGIMYHPDWSPENIHKAYSVYWEKKSNVTTNNTTNSSKNLVKKRLNN